MCLGECTCPQESVSMAFEDLALWLFTAMAIACLALFGWTLIRLVRESLRDAEAAHPAARRNSA